MGGTCSRQINKNKAITFTKVHLHTWVKPLLSQDTDMNEDWKEKNAVKTQMTKNLQNLNTLILVLIWRIWKLSELFFFLFFFLRGAVLFCFMSAFFSGGCISPFFDTWQPNSDNLTAGLHFLTATYPMKIRSTVWRSFSSSCFATVSTEVMQMKTDFCI